MSVGLFGAKPNPKPEPEPDNDRDLTPDEEVFALRYIRLLALRISPDDALELISKPDVAAQAEALYAKGCPPELIVRILT